MTRSKNSVSTRQRRKKVLKMARGYRGQKSKCFRPANEQVMHSLQYSYRDRRTRKGDFRRLWISRINAAAREHGLSYNKFINGLRNAGVDIDRKMIAEIALNDPETFRQLVDIASDHNTKDLKSSLEISNDEKSRTGSKTSDSNKTSLSK